MNSKRLISVALTASTVLWSLGIASLPLAQAQTTADLQAQISALLAQITQLQAQLGGSAGAAMSNNFTVNLTLGSKGADVSALQQILIGKGYLVISAPTGYFGALTQAALAKMQAANGISPAAGYFGPKTRAFVNSMSTGGGSTGGGSTGGGPVVSPATGLAVGLAADNPVAGSLISGSNGAARVPVFAATFAAGNTGAVTVSEVKFHKTGVLSDGSISGAYLTRNGQVIAQYNSINQGVIDFAGLNWQIPAGTSQEVVLAIDVAGGLSAGNTMGMAVVSASDISAWNTANAAVMPSGNFPMNGNTFTVTTVSNPSLATLTIASSSIGNQVTAGTQGNLVGAWNFTIQNSKVWLKGLNFKVIGSANKGDIRNLKLMVNGAQVGSTLAAVGQDGQAYFDASANPGILNTGSNNVQVFADVMGSPSYNFQFELLNGYDVYAVDSQYNVPIQSNSNTGTQVTIQQGQITVTQDAGTPTGNIAKGQSQITLAKFDIYAAGEAVRVKFLDFTITLNNASTGQSLANNIRNVALVDDAGGQVGSTINTPPSSNSCAVTGASYVTSTGVYADCFGTSGSPINYVVPANTTRVLSLKADIQSTATFSSIVAGLTAESSANLQGLTSSQTGSSGGATGSSLSLANSSLTVGLNNALGNQSVAKGVTSQRIASYAFSAASAEGVNVSNVSIQAGGVAFLQNMKLMINGAQFGTTQGTVSSGTIYTFSGSPFSVPSGGTTMVEVYADILSSASGTATPATALNGCSATGATSFTAISCNTLNGQNLTIAGQSTLSVTADSSQPPVGQVVMGSTLNSLAIFRFTETSNIEDVKLTDLNVVDTVTATATVKAAFSNLQLWNGSNPVGYMGSIVGSQSGTEYLYSFHFATPVVISRANSVSLTLKGDAAAYSSSGATDNSVHTFKIATTTDAQNLTAALAVVALGNTSNGSSTISLSSANGNALTVLRSKLTFAASPIGSTNSRGKLPSDQLATLSFTANSAGPVVVNTVAVKFSGTAPLTSTFLSGVTMRDENNVAIGTETDNVSGNCSTGTSCTVTWSFGGTTSGQIVSAGATRNWTLVVDSTKTVSATSTNNVNLVSTINAVSNITYTDGLDSQATSGLSMPTSVLTPINLNSVVYQQGT